MNITDFLDTKYRDFAISTIEARAIPSVIDGFKPSQRKIICASKNIWKNDSDKILKVFQVSGIVASTMFYHHGSQSLDAAIVNMTQSFKNNIPLFEQDGQFGSLRSPDAGASRYIGVKLSKSFNKVYKDFELLHQIEEDGQKAEFEYLLPIIPMVLINGTSGLAVGFASMILNRDVMDIINACLKILNGKKLKPSDIKPHINEFNGEFIQDKDNNKKWYMRGGFKRLNSNTIVINEIPPSMTYEKYEAVIDKLIDEKKILSYEDNSKDNINYIIKFNRNVLNTLSDDDIIKMFKLEESITEIYSTLNENDKLMIFDDVIDIINYFVKFRLPFYEKRKELMLKQLEKELSIINNRLKFIQYIIEGKLKINNVPKKEIIDNLVAMAFDKIDNSYDYLLNMHIYSLTKELYNQLKADKEQKDKEYEALKQKEYKQMYIEELEYLKKDFKC